MNKIDAWRTDARPSAGAHLDLDGHGLQLLVAVHEEGSITRAAWRLGVTQSAVSHGLERLRTLTGDALFVKSGRGIAPTAQADALVARARRLLDELRAFSTAAGFEPARLQAQVTIAANDLQRDVLLPALLRRLRAEAPGLTLRVIPAGAPQPAMLRDDSCQLALTPRPPDATDLVQRRLFDDHYRVFHDPAVRTAPASLEDYLAALHVTVRHEAPHRGLDIDDWMAAQGWRRRFVATVPGFAGLPAPIAPPPLTMYMVWHQRYQEDPMHRWLRAGLVAVAGADATDADAQADATTGPAPARS
jgi:DNA-binding transcriptional LysR family regulator